MVRRPPQAIRIAAVTAALLLFTSCASAPKPRTRLADRPAPKVGTSATGTASWYGPGYHGKRTACGEKFGSYDRTFGQTGRSNGHAGT